MSGKVWTKGNPSIAIQTYDDKFHWNPYLEVQQLERQMNTPLAAFWWEEVEGALAMKWEWVPWSWGFINGTICKYRVERYKFNRWSSFSYFVWQVGGQQFELVMSLHITNHTEDRNVEKKSCPMMWWEGMKFERYDHSWPSNILEEKNYVHGVLKNWMLQCIAQHSIIYTLSGIEWTDPQCMSV